jgi:hypothetical protein
MNLSEVLYAVMVNAAAQLLADFVLALLRLAGGA